MQENLENKFFERWPKWFDRSNPQRSLMCFGFACGDGWFDLLYKLCEDIEKVLPADYDFQVFQVKEKFGGLRFYVNNAPDAVHDLISKAEGASEATCEMCGKPGIVSGPGWLRCKCPDHGGITPP